MAGKKRMAVGGRSSGGALSVRLDRELRRHVEARAKGQHRTAAEQVRRYVEIAMTAEQNPELPIGFVVRLLEAKAEADAGLEEEVDWSVD